MTYVHTEAQLETIFRMRVRGVLGGMVVKTRGVNKSGMPDRLVLLPCNRIRLVELKTVKGKLEPLQIEWHKRVATLGVHVVVLYGLADIETWVHDCAQEYDALLELL